MVKFDDLKEEAVAWSKEYCEALNNNTNYEESAKNWGIDFEGALYIVLEACGEIEEDIAAFIDLKAGKCLGIKILRVNEDPPREPILKVFGSMLNWRKVAFKEIDIIQSLMQGVLKLEGEMSLAMRYARAAMELINTMENTDRTLFTKYDLGD
ncbi:MAG: SCP2 sterol-binding domain-containing protein [Promethearchaeota archaeon]